MTGQHSPGPWKWNGAAGIYAANGKRCANIFVAGEINLPNEEMDANARLIAAAPDLLEAICDLELRMTQAALASGIGPRKNHTDFLLGELGRMKDVARAAIAKARP